MGSFWDWLTSQTDIPDSQMGYTVNEASYNPSEYLTGAIENLQGMGNTMFDFGKNMLDPLSTINQNMRQQISGQGADATAQQNQIAIQNAARMGGGGAGIVNANQQANTAASTNAVSNAWINHMINQQGQGLGYMQGGVGATSQAGTFGAQIDSNTLQNNQFNASAQNQQAEYERSNILNQIYANSAKSGNFINQGMSLLGNIVAPGLGGAFSNYMGVGPQSTTPTNNYTSGSNPSYNYMNTNYGINQNQANNQFGNYFSNQYSDRRLKDNIEYIGKSNDGNNIYNFNYIWDSDTTYQGVMADEVPEASFKDGEYYVVDYSKLDVEFKEVSNAS